MKSQARPAHDFTLITGASAGIGAEFARVFAAKGHDLVLVARSADRLKELAEELRSRHGRTVHVIAADLAAIGAAGKVYQQVQAQGIKVDILVNNAGVLQSGDFAGIGFDRNLKLVQLNVVALTALTQLFLDPMKQRRQGRILNVSSTSAFQPLPYLATYAASKAYVLSLSEALSAELKGSGVTVTALCPGFTETELITKDSGKKMSLPLIRNLTPQQVAREGYRACMQGKPLYINGLGNRAAIKLGQLQPRWVQRSLSAALGKRGF